MARVTRQTRSGNTEADTAREMNTHSCAVSLTFYRRRRGPLVLRALYAACASARCRCPAGGLRRPRTAL